MHYENLTRELVRALRGRRSQPWLSRRIGLKSNLVYRWEAGRAAPSACQVFAMAKAAGVPVGSKLEGVLGLSSNVRRLPLRTARGVASLLRTLAGARPISELARELGKSRYVISRWLSGNTVVRFPDLLRFIHATTLRVLDFVAALVDPNKLASSAREWRKLEAARRAAFDAPWSQAVLRAVELSASTDAGRATPTQLAKRLALPKDQVEECLDLLERAGQVRRCAGRIHLTQEQLVDTGNDPSRRRQVAGFWGRVALDRLGAGASGVHAYNLFAISERDLPRAISLHREFFHSLRTLVGESAPPERVVLYACQLLPLDGGA